MEFYTLASSSAGNAALVCHNDTPLLIDAGISCRRITQSLAVLNLTLDDLDGILITHEHIDHVRGLVTLAKKMSRPAVRDVRHRGGHPIPRAAPACLCRGQRVYDQGPARPLVPHVARRERKRRLPHRERRRLARRADGHGLCHR